MKRREWERNDRMRKGKKGGREGRREGRSKGEK